MQASSMAPLGLQQCHVSARSLSGTGSSATPLPGQLLRKAVSSQNNGVPAEYCLLPLVVYNDAATLCKERLSCEAMATAAAHAADAAFEELLDLLSDAVRRTPMVYPFLPWPFWDLVGLTITRDV